MMDYKELIVELLSGDVTYLDGKAATAIEALQAKLATTERCYEKCFDERAQLMQSVEDLRDSAAVLAKERDAALAKLEALEKQAPVGYLSPGNRFYKTKMQAVKNCEQLAKPLYTSPVPAKTLTDEQVTIIGNRYSNGNAEMTWDVWPAFARAIEQALKGGA